MTEQSVPKGDGTCTDSQVIIFNKIPAILGLSATAPPGQNSDFEATSHPLQPSTPDTEFFQLFLIVILPF